jgi:hypothetical protein
VDEEGSEAVKTDESAWKERKLDKKKKSRNGKRKELMKRNIHTRRKNKTEQSRLDRHTNL